MAINDPGWFDKLPILRDNPLLRLDFSALFTGDPNEQEEDERVMATHPVKAQETIVIYGNLNFGRSAKAHRIDHRKMRDMGALIIPTVEDESTPNRENIWVAARLHHSHQRRMPAFKSKHGAEIGSRDLVWVNVTVPGIGKRVSVGVAHAPHPRMGETIYRDFTEQIHKMIERMYPDFLLFGDWNKRLGEDPCNLQRRHPNGAWKGQRIDGVFCSRSMVDRTTVKAIPQPNRKDDHPWIQCTIKP